MSVRAVTGWKTVLACLCVLGMCSLEGCEREERCVRWNTEKKLRFMFPEGQAPYPQYDRTKKCEEWRR